MTANGFSSRFLRSPQAQDRSGRRRVAGEVVSAQALHRDDPPVGEGRAAARDRAAGVARSRPAGREERTRGPQAGQATGWAWKRRSAGSSYSRRQSGHIANPAIVVAGRSYGTSRAIV